jgi:hypothetical protein
MDPTGSAILEYLRAVDGLRDARATNPAQSARVQAVKTYQQARFARTYADLLQGGRYAAAARFFLEELYGPHDFTERDAQFARIVPAVVRMFPQEIVETVAALAALHALSEALDDQMSRHVDAAILTPSAYVRAWQLTGRASDRERQIELTLDVGRALERYTRNPLLRHSLRLMRRPARAAGMGELQTFLETGFDTFGAMRGAQGFLDTIATRERALAQRLFEADPVAMETAVEAPAVENTDPLVQLP